MLRFPNSVEGFASAEEVSRVSYALTVTLEDIPAIVKNVTTVAYRSVGCPRFNWQTKVALGVT